MREYDIPMLIDSFKEERWRDILDLLAKYGKIRVNELAEQMKVSEATVRRDLEAMQGQGLLQRTHGGAMLATQPTALEISFDESQTRLLPEKIAIGREAAKLVNPGESIIIESGSTTLEFSRFLVDISPLTVLTNSLAIARELSVNNDIEIMVLGGTLRRQSASLVGPWVADILKHVRVDRAFLGVNGISVGFGMSAPNPFTAESRKAMMAAARQTVALADHNKLGVENLYFVAKLEDLDMLITDKSALPESVDNIIAAGVEVIQAGEEAY
jgi:DeoR family fructose operon transcriptional repressor